MNEFEIMYRNRIQKNTQSLNNKECSKRLLDNKIEDPILYSKRMIQDLKETELDEKIKGFFLNTACHMPKDKLISAKQVYLETNSIEEARKELERCFKKDIKAYKNLTDLQVSELVENGIGAAGVFKDGSIYATKIPSQFHQYHSETDPKKKKSHYCHCPRIRHIFLKDDKLDSVYCYCGGGFYQNIWETITNKEVEIETIKNLFDGDDCCQFKITIKD